MSPPSPVSTSRYVDVDSLESLDSDFHSGLLTWSQIDFFFRLEVNKEVDLVEPEAVVVVSDLDLEIGRQEVIDLCCFYCFFKIFKYQKDDWEAQI